MTTGARWQLAGRQKSQLVRW